MTNRYVLVFRDGGLLEAAPPALPLGADSLPELRLRTHCLATLARFRAAGYGLVLLEDDAATQARSPATAEAIDRFLATLCAGQGAGLAAVRHCEHAGADCDCALPGIGLVADLVADATLDRSASVIVGGDDRAAALGRAMGLVSFELDGGVDWAEVGHTVLDRPRRASVERTTRETSIRVEVDLDRTADPVVSTGIGFFDHMLEQLGKHGGFELEVNCKGDLEVDEHHTIEDVALTLGQALRQALGDKRGIGRYGFVLPMDEAEAQVAIDLSGRAFIVFEGEFPREHVGGLPTELVEHFFRSLSETLGAAIHVSVRGDNAHHMIEACFKGVARSLRQAFARSGSDLPSTKGAL